MPSMNTMEGKPLTEEPAMRTAIVLMIMMSITATHVQET